MNLMTIERSTKQIKPSLVDMLKDMWGTDDIYFPEPQSVTFEIESWR